MAKRQKKESDKKNLLVKYGPHRDQLAQQYKTVLVRHGNGKATLDEADFAAVAEATYGAIHAPPDFNHDTVLAALQAFSKDDLFKQSKTVGKKWWGQSGGKGKHTATVLRTDGNQGGACEDDRGEPTRGPPARASFRGFFF